MPALRPLGFKFWSFWGLFYLLVRSLLRYFVTGQSVTGRDTDNATFLNAATKDYRDNPTEKLSGPLWQRLARRWAALGVPLGLCELSVVAHVVEAIYMQQGLAAPGWSRIYWLYIAYGWWAAGALGVLCWGTYQTVQLLRHRKTTNEFVYPTWKAACGVLGVVYHARDARRMVSLPDSFEPSDVVIDEPAEHHWLARVSQAARLLDWWAVRRLAQEQAAREAELDPVSAEASDITPPEPHLEPDTVPSTDLAVRDKPGWLVYKDRFTDRGGSTVAEPDVLEAPVRISLPPGKCGADAVKKNLLQAVGPVLGMPDPNATWVLRGRHPYVELRPNRPPPLAVTYAAIQKHFDDAPIDQPVIGLAAGNRPIHIDYDNNSPHVLISGGSGTGKSVLLKAILCQRMHHGAGLVILDYKRVSHRWAHNLAGCVYAWKIATIHDVAVAAGDELTRRIEGVLPDNDDTEIELVEFQVWDILVEEINSLTPQLQAYWQRIRTSQDPVASPAITAIRQIVFMGREFRMHVHIGAQRAAANVFGGGDGGSTRENFQTRLMAKWTKQTWMMLAGGTPYQRCPAGGRGVWARVQDDEVEVVRTPFLTNQQAREWATSGVPSPPTPLDTDLSVSPVSPAGVTVPELVTLSKALEFLPGPTMTLPAIRQAASPERAKANGFPKSSGEAGAAKTYALEELIAWKLELDGRKGLEESWELPPPKRPGRVYRFNVLDPVTGASVCGYVGQTRRSLDTREAEHRKDKPWADLIIGDPLEVWYSDNCTPQELDAAELHLIHTLKPLYNYEGQEGADHAIPKWTQLEERQARQAAAGLPPWVPVDIYNERKAAVI